MVRRVTLTVIVAVILIVVFVLRSGTGDDLDALKSDLNAIQTAFNFGDYGLLHDDYLPASCRANISRADFITRFGETGRREILVELAGDPENVAITDGRAEFDLTTVALGDQPDEGTQSARLTFIREDGHWRDTNCFGATD